MDKQQELFIDIYMQGVMDAINVLEHEDFERDEVMHHIGLCYISGKVQEAYKSLIEQEDDDERRTTCHDTPLPEPDQGTEYGEGSDGSGAEDGV